MSLPTAPKEFPFPSFPVRAGPTPRRVGTPSASRQGAHASLGQRSLLQSTQSAATKKFSALKGDASGRNSVEDEYVRNLQQQIYLLELETRYLKNRRGEDDDESLENPAATLKDTFRSLKSKYVELQDKFKLEIKKLETQLESSQEQNTLHERSVDSLKSENSSLHEELRKLRAARENQNDVLHTEFLQLRQTQEITLAENKRLQSSYDRMLNEKAVLENRISQLNAQNNDQKETIASQQQRMDVLKKSADESIRMHVQLQSQIDPMQTNSPASLQKTNEELVLENTALRAQVLQMQAYSATHDNTVDRLKDEIKRISLECSNLQTEIVEVQREQRRAQQLLAEERERAQKEKDLRDKKRKELAGSDELLSNIEEVEIAILKRELRSLRGDLSLKDERIQESELHIEQAHQQISELAESNRTLEERAAEVLSSIKHKENELVVLEEEKRSLAVALSQIEDHSSAVEAEVHAVKEKMLKKEVDLDAATKEIYRLKHIQNVSQQMQEWKAMMEESSKMADQMKNLVSVFHEDAVNADEPTTDFHEKKVPVRGPVAADSSLDVVLSQIRK